MVYLEDEKIIAQAFINSPLPECIKWNELHLPFDAMECYEALFDYAHCVIDNQKISSNFSCVLTEKNFADLIVQLRTDGRYEVFCDKATAFFKAIQKYQFRLC